jgi:hypothetical protein
MTYRSPENQIRRIMAKTAGVTLNEDIGQASHMTPSLKTPEEERLTAAVNVLKNHGVPSAKVDGNNVSISAAEANMASDVLQRALDHGLITVRPNLVSAEAIPMPEPHVPAPEFAKEENLDLPDAKDEEDQTPKGEVKEPSGEVKLEPRTLRNRQENQLKKVDEAAVDRDINRIARENMDKSVKTEEDQIDELSHATHRSYEKKSVDHQIDMTHVKTKSGDYEPRQRYTSDQKRKLKNRSDGEMLSYAKRGVGVNQKAKVLAKEDIEQVDELSTTTLHKVANAARKQGRKSVLNAAIAAGKRKKNQPDYKFAGEENIEVEEPGVQALDELSTATLMKYSKAAQRGRNPLDKKIGRRQKGIKAAAEKLTKRVFGEDVNPLDMLKRVRSLAEASNMRLKATIHSDCGNHCAKIYKDTEWNEHRVKFHINGQHHEPADYHTDDYHDAHGTAVSELKRLSKLNGALKESTEEEILEVLEDEQIDELSKALLGRYIAKAAPSLTHRAERATTLDIAANSPAGSKAHDFLPSTERKASSEHLAKKSMKYASKTLNREHGIQTAAAKMTGQHIGPYRSKPVKVSTKEEVAKEGDTPFLAELSKGKLAAYVDKATTDIHNHGFKSGEHWGAGETKKMVKPLHKSLSRQLGVKKAVDRLAKEEVEIAEVSKDLLKRYTKAAGKSIADPKTPGNKVDNRINGIRKAHFKVMTREETEVNEISGALARRYMSAASADHAQRRYGDVNAKGDRVGHTSLLRQAREKRDAGEPGGAEEYKTQQRKIRNRSQGMDRALKVMDVKEDMRPAVNSPNSSTHPHGNSLRHIGTYKSASGHYMKMVRSPNDRKHLMLVNHEHTVVDSHYGNAEDFHKKVTGGIHGLKGYLHESTQIDELSKGKLASYVNKAAASASSNGFGAGRASMKPDGHPEYLKANAKVNRRKVGIDRAVKKLAEAKSMFTVANGTTHAEMGDNHEHIWSHKGHKLYRQKDDHKQHVLVRPDKTVHSMYEGPTETVKASIKHHGLDALAYHHEEVQIDEVSKGLLGRYITRAVAHHGFAKMELGRSEEHFDAQAREPEADEKEEHFTPHEKLLKKRSAGIDRAVKKLTKESLDEEVQIDELSKDTLLKYAVKAASSKRDHITKGAAAFARGNAQKGEADVKNAQKAAGGDHMRKARNRHKGIKTAMRKLGE